MKKNRRGLGRGLEALIQNTVPDGDSAGDQVEGIGTAPEGSRVSRLSEASPYIDSEGRERFGAASTTEEKTEQLEAASEASLTPSVPETAEETAKRYLPHEEAPSTDGRASRETRRPVDVFFPDRLTDSSRDPSQRADGRPATPSNGRRRPTMPAVNAAASLKSSTAVRSTDGEAEKQLNDVDQFHTEPSDVAAGDEGEDAASANLRDADLAGTAELRSIPVQDIHPNPRQPREVFDEEDMDELVASITEVGVLQPIVVRPVQGTTPYELVMGERRWRASQRAGMATIPAIVRHTSDTNLLRDALLENLHRSQLNPLEEAAAYEQLLDDFGCTQDELSTRIGRSRPQISNTLRLLRLPPMVQRRVASGVLSAGHARALLGLADPGEMEKLAQKVVSEGLSVRSTEELVSLHDGIRQAKPRSRAPRSDRHERIDYLASSLTDQLDTTVKITLGARKGKIAIDFASVEDLNRIMALIQPSGAKNSQL